jgi:hypothetical protein
VQRIDALLRGSTAGDPPLQAEARVEARPSSWQLQMVLRDERRGLVERRELAAADCAALAEAFALIVAVHVDALRVDANAVVLERPVMPPPAGAAATTVSAARPATPVEGPTPRPSSTPTRRPTAAPAPTLRGLLRFEGGAEIGMLPGVGGGAGVMGGVVGRAWRLELGAGGWPVRSAATAGVGVRLDLVVGRVRACWAPAVARWHVPICGGGELGGLRGVGTTGVARPNAQWTPWGAATASVGVAWSLRPWIGPYAAVETVAAFARPRFSVGEQPVASAHGVGIRAMVGIELKFRITNGTPREDSSKSPRRP